MVALLDAIAGRLWAVGQELLRRAGVGLRLAPGSPRWWPMAVALAGVFAWLGVSVCLMALLPWSAARMATIVQRLPD